jgi:dolichol-phosphate mannosyltransferase
MIAYTRTRLERLLKIEFIRFCIVGGTGFSVNFVLLVLLHRLFHLEIFVAQLISGEIALFSNFMLHHHWTYKSHNVNKSFRTLLIQFHSTTWPAIIGSTLMVGFGEKLIHLSTISALTLSSVISLFWNFFWSKYVIWRHVTPQEVEKLT